MQSVTDGIAAVKILGNSGITYQAEPYLLLRMSASALAF